MVTTWQTCRKAMALLQKLLPALLIGACLLAAQKLLERRRLPELPLRLSLLALLCWALLPLLEGLPVSAVYRTWLALIDDLLLSLACLRLGLWLLLELPAGLGWWRQPPQLLVQLLMLGAGAGITVIVVRESARVDLVGLLATSAVVTAVLGLAAQETLKDLFAGLELQLGDDFSVGDWLELSDGVQGIVESIAWRDTMLRNLDGCRLVIPNSKITAEVITNRSASGVASNRFEVGLDYSFPPAQARALLDSVLHQHPQVLSSPMPRVRLKRFDASAISYELQAWQQEMTPQAVQELRSDLQEQIWYALQRAGQTIPFPVQELQPRRRSQTAGSSQLSGQDLESCSLFVGLTPEQRQQLATAGTVAYFAPGEAIVREGNPGDCLYQLLAGRVDVIKNMGAKGNLSVRQLGPGEHFGEMTLLLDTPRSATVRALEECQLLQLNRAALAPLLQAQPDLLNQLADQMERRRQELNQLGSGDRESETTTLLATMRRLFQAFTGSSSASA